MPRIEDMATQDEIADSLIDPAGAQPMSTEGNPVVSIRHERVDEFEPSDSLEDRIADSLVSKPDEPVDLQVVDEAEESEPEDDSAAEAKQELQRVLEEQERNQILNDAEAALKAQEPRTVPQQIEALGQFVASKQLVSEEAGAQLVNALGVSSEQVNGPALAGNLSELSVMAVQALMQGAQATPRIDPVMASHLTHEFLSSRSRPTRSQLRQWPVGIVALRRNHGLCSFTCGERVERTKREDQSSTGGSRFSQCPQSRARDHPASDKGTCNSSGRCFHRSRSWSHATLAESWFSASRSGSETSAETKHERVIQRGSQRIPEASGQTVKGFPTSSRRCPDCGGEIFAVHTSPYAAPIDLGCPDCAQRKAQAEHERQDRQQGTNREVSNFPFETRRPIRECPKHGDWKEKLWSVDWDHSQPADCPQCQQEHEEAVRKARGREGRGGGGHGGEGYQNNDDIFGPGMSLRNRWGLSN